MRSDEAIGAAAQLIGAILNGDPTLAGRTAPVRCGDADVVAEPGLAIEGLGRRDPLSDSTPVHTVTEELAAELQRSTANIAGVALLVARMGAPAELVREVIGDHLLKRAAEEQRLVLALLRLPREGRARRGAP